MAVSISECSTQYYRSVFGQFLGRSLRTKLDSVLPNRPSVQSTSTELKVRQFAVGDLVWVRDYLSREVWRKGKVIEVTGPLTYVVHVAGKGEWKRHVGQMHLRIDSNDPSTNDKQQSINVAPAAVRHRKQ